MSSRLRNLMLIFATSLLMWVALIQGSLSLYSGVSGPDSMTTASVR